MFAARNEPNNYISFGKIQQPKSSERNERIHMVLSEIRQCVGRRTVGSMLWTQDCRVVSVERVYSRSRTASKRFGVRVKKFVSFQANGVEHLNEFVVFSFTSARCLAWREVVEVECSYAYYIPRLSAALGVTMANWVENCERAHNLFSLCVQQQQQQRTIADSTSRENKIESDSDCWTSNADIYDLFFVRLFVAVSQEAIKLTASRFFAPYRVKCADTNAETNAVRMNQ